MKPILKKVGDWLKAGKMIANIKTEMKESQRLSLQRFGMKVERIAVEHMSAQDLPWKRLKPKTLSRKLRLGYSRNILIETSTYYQNITHWIKDDKVYAGVKREVVTADGEEVAKIAEIHEYGSKSGNIPARPLWQPTFKEAIAWHQANNNPVSHFMRKIKQYL